MSTFEDREKAQEAKFAHDAELRFKAEARSHKLLGLWAADRIGHKSPADYAAEIVAAEFAVDGEAHVIARLLADLDAAGQPVTENELLRKIDEFRKEARRQVLGEA
jgi:hypothetical protein